MPKKAIAIYLRVSTDKQLLEAQETAIENWLAAHSIDHSSVVYYRDEGLSGSSTNNRPGLQTLLHAIRGGAVKTLVTFELSRLSRDYMDFLRILELCDKHGVTIQVP